MSDVRDMVPYQPISGTLRHGHIRIQITFDPILFEQIKAEALLRGWTFSRMVRHLCEASIEGIE